MNRRIKDKGRLPPFVPVFRLTMKSAAWRIMSVGAKAAFLHLKANYNSNAQNSVWLSERDGMKELGVGSRRTVAKYLRELEHYGFIVKVKGAHLGVSGVGESARYRLTDCAYAGKPATYEFQNWDGVLFESRPRSNKPNGKLGSKVIPFTALASGSN
jgi:hypothetical protein